MWITMCKTEFPKYNDVDIFVEKLGCYPQLKKRIVEN